MHHLAAKGWVCVAINYRLAPRDPFPAQIIDVKRAIYLEHPACEVVLIAEQDRMEVRIDVKTEKGWTATTLRGGDELHLAAFGLRCDVADLYEGTPLNPRPTIGRRLG